ncbi:MAG: hypothetical protein H6Q35_1359 [Proteobacteria bacterium]|nr:hypothetical protein [Pseudomonadota bacterium]
MALSKKTLAKTKCHIPPISILSFKLLLEAYFLALENQQFNLKWFEDQFTNHLITFMKKSDLTNHYPLDITPQYPLIKDTLPIGHNNPKSLPIIDIRIFNWNSPESKEYFFEAKNLYENNYGTKKASSYINRYIDTGIENFRTEKYTNGSIVGYVLNGKVENIINSLNMQLFKNRKNYQAANCIKKLEKSDKIIACPYCYESLHHQDENNIKKIQHIFLDFCNT